MTYNKTVIKHYDTQDGIGNAYVLVADWPVAIKASIFKWENVLEHPAAVHYARDYEGSNFNGALLKTGYEVFEKLKLKSGKVLDCGCGVGGTTLSLAKNNPDIDFYGISLSSGQVFTAKTRASKSGITNATYVVGNYLELPFPDNYFDGIMGIETFCHIEDSLKPQLFKELFRVLKPDGIISICDAFLNERSDSEMSIPELHTRIFRGWTLPDKISRLSFVKICAQNQGFLIISEKDLTDRILGCSKEAMNRAKLLKPLKPLVYFLILLRKFGIKLPVFAYLGLDSEMIFEFAYTSEHQYEMFRSRDTIYSDLILRKSS